MIDFGIAKLVSGAQPARTAPMGTLAWMAPEQTEVGGAIGPATDLWALGLVVFFLLTGQSYWPTLATLPVLLRKLVVDPIVAASARAAELGCGARLPPGFVAWFERAVVRDPAARFASAALARAELERVLSAPSPSITRDALAVTAAAPLAAPIRRWRVPLDDSPRRGPRDALVTIVEFGDFECPFSLGAVDALRELLAEHPDDVALVWKDVPQDAHPSAHGAARLARLARRERGEEAFWIAHDRLFEMCPSRGLDGVDQLGAELGLEPSAVAAAIAGPDDPGTTRDIEEALDFRAELIPQLFVNGRRVVGWRSLGRLRGLVDEELAAARARVASGLPRAQVFEELTRDAAGPLAPDAPRSLRAEKQRAGKIVGARARVDVHQFVDRTSSFAALLERTRLRFLEKHGDLVRFHFHELVDFDDPTSVDVATAARASLEVGGDAGYWRMHELLVENAPHYPPTSTPSRGFERATLFRYAKEAGLHDAYFRLSFDNPERRVELERTRDIAAELGVRRGEFLLLVGGYPASGLLLRQLERSLERALDDAR